jgi:FtsH-binding integral membrane protein
MEKPHVEISVANDPKKENQANKKEIQEPNININYDMPYTSGSSTIDNHLKNTRENEKQNVYIVQPQEAEYSIYLNIRNMFILKVFGILLFQLAFTFAIVLICQINIIKDFLFSQSVLGICLLSIAIFVYLVLFIIFLCKPTLMRRVPANYIIIFIATICLTIILVYLSINYKLEIIVASIAVLFAICLAMFIIGLFNKIEIGYCSIALIGLLFLALNYGILAAIYRSYYLYFLYVSIVGIIYAFFIAYDTTIIRDEFSIDDYAFAALTLYFDIIRLFIFILQIFGGGNRN